MSQQIEITGKFIEERFRFENDVSGIDTIIASIHCNGQPNNPPEVTNQYVTIKGEAQLGELRRNMAYRFFGSWKNYKNNRTGKLERQFAFNSFTTVEPVGRESIVAYLVHHGGGCGLGRVRANALYEAFGEDAVRTARMNPDLVAETLTARGLYYPNGKADYLKQSLESEFATEQLKLDLTGLLNGRGFPKSTVSTIIQEWGNRGASIIRRNPYRLMEFKGCGFKRCDSMYLDLGLDPTRLKRQAMCAWYSVSKDNDGHTWFGWKIPDAYLRMNISSVGSNGVDVERALKLAVRGRKLSMLKSSGDRGPIAASGNVRWFAEFDKAKHERQIADAVLRAQTEAHFWPDVSELNLTEHQKETLANALKSSVCLLGGSPGTGKTWTVAELVIAIAAKIGIDNVLIGAPTGKAAVRVAENLQAKGIDLRARTWHSLLMQLETQKLTQFRQKVLIGDESSMLDTDLMAAILKARATGTMVLFVGDVNQLPPVGHGAPLRDLIAAGVFYGELKKIERNSGGIVETCAAIRDQQPWNDGDNLHLVATAAENKNGHIDCIKEIFRHAEEENLDPIWDVQIVTAVNEKSPLSRVELNKHLQQILNHQPGEEGIEFRVGDKVVNSKNGFFKSLLSISLVDSGRDELDSNDKDEVYVANGELAKVISVDRASMVLDLDSPQRRIQVFFSQEGGCTFELGYALSVHKSQGSDWPWVAVMLDDYPGARMVCDRSWLYTAISRAKRRCWLVGLKNTAVRMCRTSKIWHRKTFLKELILDGLARGKLSEV